MDRVTAVGATLTVLSVVGYAVATVAPYPGRSVTLPGVMVGLTLLAVGGAADHDVTGSAPTDTDPAAGGYTDPTAGEPAGSAGGGPTGDGPTAEPPAERAGGEG